MLRPSLLCLLSAVSASALTWLTTRPAASSPSTTTRTTPASLSASSPHNPSPSARPSAAASSSTSSSSRPSAPPDAAAIPDLINQILATSDPLEQSEAFSALLRQLTPENAAAAWQALSSHQGTDAARFTTLFAHQWGTIDGPGALKTLASSKNRDAYSARYHVMSGWASRDPDTALAHLNAAAKATANDPDGSNQNRRQLALLKAGIADGMARSNPDAATRWIASLDEKERGPLLASLASRQMDRGFDTASQWADSISDPSLRAAALASVAHRFASESPESAAAWAASTASKPGGQLAVGAVAREWTARDPEKAVAWISSLPEGPARQEAWEDAMRSWTRNDPEASSQHLKSMPPGPSRDAAVSSLSRTIARNDPTAAIAWANTIADPAARSESLLRTAQLWNSVDAPAASQWAASNLPPDLQQRFASEPFRQKNPSNRPFKKLPGAPKPAKRR
ncbi:MAG: hypothetical protein DVB22_000717 [Verrucomicrobia bacterium]|nr:MAG: hypothetical protein DVB22_000717 [Verrucomicrobiota bacterium]